VFCPSSSKGQGALWGRAVARGAGVLWGDI